MALSFAVLDYCIVKANMSVENILESSSSSTFFTLAWILFLITFILLFHGKVKKIIYIIVLLFFQIMLLTNYIYCGIFNTFFSFKSLGMAGEAKEYFNVIFDYISSPLIITIILSVVFCVLTCKFMPKNIDKFDFFLAILFFTLSIVFYSNARAHLGKSAPSNAWNTWAYSRNVYNFFSDTRKSLKVSGFYEYIMRDIYLSKIAVIFSTNKETVTYLNDYFAFGEELNYTDEWYGKFKDKNVIIVLMESIDDFLVTEETMPTVNRMMKEGINFSNHYAPVYVGGATFNSEFMINTGYMTPLNGENASNKYGNNYFPCSLPNLFKNAGYTANFFHENKKSYYNRGQMSKVFGYDNYYSSIELGLPYKEVVKDSHFITNQKIKKLLLPTDKKFMDFVITYSAHTPYTVKRSQCNVTLTDDERAQIQSGGNENQICIKAQARETDNFFKDLIDTLTKENKIDNTIIIGITDHYAYAYPDREMIYKLKGTDDSNLVSKVPFFIWGNDIKPLEITEVNSNIDILPTVAHLFGLSYISNYYIGKNIFDNDYNNFVFFNNNSWYDGDIYYKDGRISTGKNDDEEYIIKRNKEIIKVLKINDDILNTNYFYNSAKEN
jgi:phosphoglycerol transferase MdoB-like AlkP superfamily enzyme